MMWLMGRYGVAQGGVEVLKGRSRGRLKGGCGGTGSCGARGDMRRLSGGCSGSRRAVVAQKGMQWYKGRRGGSL